MGIRSLVSQGFERPASQEPESRLTAATTFTQHYQRKCSGPRSRGRAGIVQWFLRLAGCRWDSSLRAILYGFGAQLWFGHRHKREPAILPNAPPVAALAASTTTITLPCQPGFHSTSGACPASVSTNVSLTTTASDPDGDTLLYSYTVTGGRISGEGANVSWDLSGVGPGTYTASVDVDDGCGCITAATTTVTIAELSGLCS